RALELAAFCGGVLVAEPNVELAAEKTWFETARRDLAEQDPNVAVSEPEPGDCGRHEAREGGRKRAETHLVAVFVGEVSDLSVGQLQTPCEVICVFEQHLAGAREAQSAASPVKQAYADLRL